jgi:CDGSH-type Zn-finger protein
VRGAVQVVGADAHPYERRERQTLCRCGQSGNKPFCDGSHWYAGFRDPLPPELVKTLPSVFEWAGGLEASSG